MRNVIVPRSLVVATCLMVNSTLTGLLIVLEASLVAVSISIPFKAMSVALV